MQDAHILLSSPPRMWNYLIWGRTSDSVEASIPQKKRRVRDTVLWGCTSINQSIFVLFFNGNFWKHSASVKFKSRLWLSLLYVVLWEQSKKYIDRILDFMQFVVPFWHAQLLTRCRWRYSLGCATHQLASSRRPISKGATRKTAKLTERLE